MVERIVQARSILKSLLCVSHVSGLAASQLRVSPAREESVCNRSWLRRREAVEGRHRQSCPFPSRLGGTIGITTTPAGFRMTPPGENDKPPDARPATPSKKQDKAQRFRGHLALLCATVIGACPACVRLDGPGGSTCQQCTRRNLAGSRLLRCSRDWFTAAGTFPCCVMQCFFGMGLKHYTRRHPSGPRSAWLPCLLLLILHEPSHVVAPIHHERFRFVVS